MSVEDFYKGSKEKFIRKILPIVKSRDIAEDIIQDATLLALETYHNYDPSRAKEETWFNCLVFTTLWNWKRSQKRLPPTVNIEDYLETEALLSPEYSMFVEGVSNPLHQKILHLYFIQGYKPVEIAKFYNLTEVNVKKILQRKKGYACI